MSVDGEFEEINEAKVNMDHIYDETDPRAYFRELKKLQYKIPGAAKPIFQNLISGLRHSDGEPVTILDIGCSYGVNAALLKYDLSMPDLYQHWGQEGLVAATREEVIQYDQHYFDKLDDPENIEMIGLDQAGNAIEFAEEIGLLDDGLAVNLEVDPLPDSAKEELTSVDLIMSTGCVGYVTEKTFDNLLPTVTQGRSPWLANFVLRMFPFDVIEEALKPWGYVTEKLENRTFVQREFASTGEQAQVIDQLRGIDVDATGLEDQGQLLAEFYLSRPKEEVEKVSLEELLAA